MPAFPKRYLIGFGNYAQGDDGVGLHVIEYIVEHDLDQGFEAIEVGDDGMRLLTYFAPDTERIVIIDAALLDRKPGDYEIFSPDDVQTQKALSRFTTHEGDVLKLIALGKQLDLPIPRLSILAIQPKSCENTMVLSEPLSQRLTLYARIATDQLLD